MFKFVTPLTILKESSPINNWATRVTYEYYKLRYQESHLMKKKKDHLLLTIDHPLQLKPADFVRTSTGSSLTRI